MIFRDISLLRKLERRLRQSYLRRKAKKKPYIPMERVEVASREEAGILRKGSKRNAETMARLAIDL